jgi:hypothetical protein
MVIAKPSNNLSEPETVTIGPGASLSGDINMAGRQPVGVFMPATWTAAAITFQVSPDGVTFYDLNDFAEAEYDIAAPVAGEYMQIDPLLFRGARYLRVRSGTSGVPVNQGSGRDLLVMFAEPNKNY